MTMLQLMSLAMLIAVAWIGWLALKLAEERQRAAYWRSKATDAEYYLSPQDFPTVTVPQSDCVRVFSDVERNAP